MKPIWPHFMRLTPNLLGNFPFQRDRITRLGKCLRNCIGVAPKMAGQRRKASPLLTERRFYVLHVHS
jgi:hypothetical protein